MGHSDYGPPTHVTLSSLTHTLSTLSRYFFISDAISLQFCKHFGQRIGSPPIFQGSASISRGLLEQGVLETSTGACKNIQHYNMCVGGGKNPRKSSSQIDHTKVGIG